MVTINDRIVDAARGWIGTRFHHQGRLKKCELHKGGVDYLGLLAGIAKELDLCTKDGRPLAVMDEIDYPHYPDGMRLKARLGSVLDEVSITEVTPGDILLLIIDKNPQHLAIVTGKPGDLSIIHAYAPARSVVEHSLDPWWLSNIETVFRYPD